ncbi:serpin family protein [Microlunatus soli]|uniref:Serpin B n=1 Tax=Microlunatus soli TaxID=630515 RepID=A0A1H2A7B1_9ACTN|nr:serpin family protein [Microlunatus soli]SDT41850.1 serpin B [Microlunatus soli]
MAEADRPIEFRALTDFSAALHRAVGDSADNVLTSPYSVAAALTMALCGARGRTADELCTLLGVPDPDAAVALLGAAERQLAPADSARNPIVALANALWVQDGFMIDKDYLRTLADDMSAEPRQADFGADPTGSAAAINSWVGERTRGKITELLDASMLDELTRLVLVNAAYFKGNWRQPFLGQTRPEPFTRSDGVVVEAPMMHQRFDPVGYRRTEDWQAIRLPFTGGMAMALLLPEPDRTLPRLVRSMDGELLAGLLDGFDNEPVELTLPRWRFRTRRELTPTLQGLGVTAAFDQGAADFGGIADGPLVISDVIHEAFVAVDEQGAEAAAATGVAVAARAAVIPREARTVIFDRPFLFVIFETARRIPLFIGQLQDPTVQ